MFFKKKKNEKWIGELFERLQNRPWPYDKSIGDDEAAQQALGLFLAEVDTFVAAGFDLDTPYGDSSTTMLAYACWQGELEVVKHLVTSGARINKMACDGPGLDTHSPLAGACDGGRFEVVEFLLSVGADTNVVDADGRSVEDRVSRNYGLARELNVPLSFLDKTLKVLRGGDLSAAAGDDELAEIERLLEGGSEMTEHPALTRLNELIGISDDLQEMAALLAEIRSAGVDIDTRSEIHDITLLGEAADRGAMPVVQLLLNAGADPNTGYHYNEQCTPLVTESPRVSRRVLVLTQAAIA